MSLLDQRGERAHVSRTPSLELSELEQVLECEASTLRPRFLQVLSGMRTVTWCGNFADVGSSQTPTRAGCLPGRGIAYTASRRSLPSCRQGALHPIVMKICIGI